MVNLSRLEEIKDLRTVWPHEAMDFTPWLSQDDNIGILAEAVGLDITVDETESAVGNFNVDIFASETGTDRTITEKSRRHLPECCGICGTIRKCRSIMFRSLRIIMTTRTASRLRNSERGR